MLKFDGMQIDHIFIINLPHREDRRLMAMNQVDYYGLMPVTYMPAIYGQHIKRTDCQEQNKGALGCSASHLEVFFRATLMGLDNYLVLEDDYQILEPDAVLFRNRMHMVTSQLPEDWDILYLGAGHREQPMEFTSDLLKIRKALTTHAMLVNCKSLAMIEAMATYRYQQPIDGHLADLQYEAKLNCYVANPPLAGQLPGHSDIEGRHMEYPWLKDRLN